jgi:hypothetical protein
VYFHLLNYSKKAAEFVVLSDGKSSRDDFPLFSDLEGKVFTD